MTRRHVIGAAGGFDWGVPSHLKRLHTESQNSKSRVDVQSSTRVFQLRKLRPRAVNAFVQGHPHLSVEDLITSPTRRLPPSPGSRPLPAPFVWAWEHRGGAGTHSPAPRRRCFWAGPRRAAREKRAGITGEVVGPRRGPGGQGWAFSGQAPPGGEGCGMALGVA